MKLMIYLLSNLSNRAINMPANKQGDSLTQRNDNLMILNKREFIV